MHCGDILTKILEGNINIDLVQLTNIISSFFQSGCFPEELKMAEVLPIFKNKDSLDKENYKSNSILSHI